MISLRCAAQRVLRQRLSGVLASPSLSSITPWCNEVQLGPMETAALRRLSCRQAHHHADRHRNYVDKSKRKAIPEITHDMYQKSLYVKSILPRGEMDADTFQFCLTAIEAYAKSDKIDVQMMELAEALLDRIADEISSPTIQHHPVGRLSATPYIQIMRGWARTRTNEALDRCRNLLERMEERHQREPDRHPNPHQKHLYSALLYTCGLTSHPEARSTADAWMSAMEIKAKENKTHLPVELYNQVILVHAQKAADEYGAAAAAEDWLLRLSKLHSQECGPSPTTSSFNRVLRAWSLSPESFAVKRAQVILNLMMQLKEDHKNIQPDPDTFAVILLACARHGQPELAEETWQATLDYFVGLGIPVDLSQCFNALTLAWSSCHSPNSADRIEHLLQRRREQVSEFDGIIYMDNIGEALSNFLVALVRTGKLEKADRSLRQIMEAHVMGEGPMPLSDSVHYVVNAYNQSNFTDKGERAATLLLKVCEWAWHCSSIPRPENRTFNLCMEMCLGQKETHSLAWQILEAAETTNCANTYTYAVLIQALCKERSQQSTFEALRALQKLNKADADPKSPVRIRSKDAGLYTKVLTSLAAVPDPKASAMCLELFEHVKHSRRWQPSTRMYTSVIFGLREGGPEGRRQAFQLFRELLEAADGLEYKDTIDSFVFETLLQRVLRSKGDVEAAKLSLEVLDTMTKLYDGGRKELEPNRVCLDACLVSLVDSGDPVLLQKARNLLEDIIKRRDCGRFSAFPSRGVVQMVRKAFMEN